MFLRQDAPPPVPATGGPGGEPRGVGIIRGVIIIGIPPRKLRSADSPRLSVCSSVQRSTYSQCGRNARGDSWVAPAPPPLQEGVLGEGGGGRGVAESRKCT